MFRKLILVLISLSLVGFLAWLSKVTTTANQIFEISSGSSLNKIALDLKSAGVIKSVFIFKIVVKLQINDRDIAAGSYNIGSVKSILRLVRVIGSGPLSSEKVIRFIEGWNLRDINVALKTNSVADYSSLYKLTGEPAKDYRTSKIKPVDFAQSFDFLADKPKTVGMEGYLFPDTYNFGAKVTSAQVIKTMLENFGRKLDPTLRANMASEKHTIFETVTMASIIEREVQTERDRKLVADIFWRRYKLGMPLQADSTVNYATGKSSASVSADDLNINSPWNTYKYSGLPLGPIANPGLDSLKAAIYPEANNFWYFLTDSGGKVYYSKTFAEHLANKKKYLR